MRIRNCYNKDGEPLYVLHFPGTGMDGNEYIIDENLNRNIILSDNISIISIMNKSCFEKSPIRIQCKYNDIPLYNTAFDESKWDNTLKIDHILKSLKQTKTKYCLILDGRDTVICNNLDDEFIRKFKSLKKPIVYNGTPAAYPGIPIESLQEVISIKGKQKYLNAGVCIGEKDALYEFYSRAAEIKEQFNDNHSEQLIIRKTRILNPHLAGFDSQNNIFRIVHQYDTRVEETNDGYIFI